jgi:ABC-type uncharacterized transport system ATPase subunit
VSLRLPVGSVTVLLGPSLARHRVMNALDESSRTCRSDHAIDVCRLRAHRDDGVVARLEALDTVRRGSASVVLVDRFTDGLSARERRAVLARLQDIAAGRVVLVHDVDPVAALAVAGGAVRIDRTGGLVFEPIDELDYLAS